MGIHVTGIRETLKAIGKARVADAVAVDAGLRKSAEVVLRKALKYVPVDTGALAASGVVTTNGKKGLGAVSEVAFGGDSAPYALYVHENLEAFHEPPTGAKFLEKATREVRGTIASVVKREVQDGTVKSVDGKDVK